MSGKPSKILCGIMENFAGIHFESLLPSINQNTMYNRGQVSNCMQSVQTHSNFHPWFINQTTSQCIPWKVIENLHVFWHDTKPCGTKLYCLEKTKRRTIEWNHENWLTAWISLSSWPAQKSFLYIAKKDCLSKFK